MRNYAARKKPRRRQQAAVLVPGKSTASAFRDLGGELQIGTFKKTILAHKVWDNEISRLNHKIQRSKAKSVMAQRYQ